MEWCQNQCKCINQMFSGNEKKEEGWCGEGEGRGEHAWMVGQVWHVYVPKECISLMLKKKRWCGEGEGRGEHAWMIGQVWHVYVPKKDCVNPPLLARVIVYLVYTSLDWYPASRGYHCTFRHT